MLAFLVSYFLFLCLPQHHWTPHSKLEPDSHKVWLEPRSFFVPLVLSWAVLVVLLSFQYFYFSTSSSLSRKLQCKVSSLTLQVLSGPVRLQCKVSSLTPCLWVFSGVHSKMHLSLSVQPACASQRLQCKVSSLTFRCCRVL